MHQISRLLVLKHQTRTEKGWPECEVRRLRHLSWICERVKTTCHARENPGTNLAEAIPWSATSDIIQKIANTDQPWTPHPKCYNIYRHLKNDSTGKSIRWSIIKNTGLSSQDKPSSLHFLHHITTDSGPNQFSDGNISQSYWIYKKVTALPSLVLSKLKFKNRAKQKEPLDIQQPRSSRQRLRKPEDQKKERGHQHPWNQNTAPTCPAGRSWLNFLQHVLTHQHDSR